MTNPQWPQSQGAQPPFGQQIGDQATGHPGATDSAPPTGGDGGANGQWGAPPQSGGANPYGGPTTNGFGPTPTANPSPAQGASAPSGPYPGPQADPYSSSQSAPYSTAQADPYAGSQSAPSSGAQADPYAGAQPDPYAGSQAAPYAGAQTDPYAGSQADPYAGTQAIQTFGGATGDAYGAAPTTAAPAQQPVGYGADQQAAAPQTSAYGAPPTAGYETGQTSAYGTTQTSSYGTQQTGSYGAPGTGLVTADTLSHPQGGGPGQPGGPAAPAKKKPSPILWVALAGGLVVLLVGGFFLTEFLVKNGAVSALEAKAAAISVEGADGAITGYTVAAPDGMYLFKDGYDQLTFVSGAGSGPTYTVDGQAEDLATPASQVTVTGGVVDVERVLSELTIDGDDFDTFASESETRLETKATDGGYDVTFTVTANPSVKAVAFVAISVADGALQAQVTDLKITVNGSVDRSYDDQEPMSFTSCSDVSGAETELTSVKVTSTGATGDWTVTGSGATLDNLGVLGSCA